jgi:hypothetical protein
MKQYKAESVNAHQALDFEKSKAETKKEEVLYSLNSYSLSVASEKTATIFAVS